MRKWLSQKDMRPLQAAEPLGCSVATAYLYANGSSVPARPRIAALARAMGYSQKRLLAAVERQRQQSKGAA